MNVASRLWRHFWDQAPRQLTVTKEGRLLLVIAFAVGFAAINTGNNLLYLGWGMVLSAIVLSGVLSESTLRVLAVEVEGVGECRALETASIALRLINRSKRLPAYAVEMHAEIQGGEANVVAQAPFQMRIQPGRNLPVSCRFVPPLRGMFVVERVVVSTAYPFGFFEKSRRMLVPRRLVFWVYPARIDVAPLLGSLRSLLGEAPAGTQGMGDDFFSLRPHRDGDDPRHIHWRRSARSARYVVIEHESTQGREVILELWLGRGGPTADNEHAIAVTASLAEELLRGGFRVGLRAGAASIAPDAESSVRRVLLSALARLDARHQSPTGPVLSTPARIALVAPGGNPGAAQVRINTGRKGQALVLVPGGFAA